MRAPWPILQVSITPKRIGDVARLAQTLAECQRTDSNLHVASDPALGLTTLGANSEMHLDAVVRKLIQDYRIDIQTSAVHVAYRETLTCRVEKDYTYQKRSLGVSEYGRIKIVVEPNTQGAGNLFVSQILVGTVPEQWLPGIERGIATAGAAGILAGHPVIDVKTTLTDGAFHSADSSANTFETAARKAFREALVEGRSVVLEPIMSLEVTAPTAYAGALLGDLRARRGVIETKDRQDDRVMIASFVPFANLFGYTSQLRQLTQGRGTFVMRYARYEPVPPPNNVRPPPAVAAAQRA